MKNISEGNLYNVQTEISKLPTQAKGNLDGWKNEVRKQLLEILARQNIPNAEKVMKSIFGQTLE